MNYAVDYAPSDVSRVCCWEDVDFGILKPTVIEFGAEQSTREEDKKEFLSKLGSDDVLYIELGGPTGRFVQAADKQGCAIFRIPTTRLKEERVMHGFESDQDAALMRKLSIESPNLFYPFLSQDRDILNLGSLVAARQKAQEARKQAVHRLISAHQDLALVQDDPPSQDEIEAKVLSLPGIEESMRQEDEFSSRVETEVKKLPVYRHVFASIQGCGPQIGAELIVGIGDIRRFPDRDHLVNYTTYGFFKDSDGGTSGVPKLRRYARDYNGLKANERLGQAVWKFTRQVWRYGRRYWSGKQMLLARLGKEHEKHPDFPYPRCVARAMRWYGQKFLHYVYGRWNAYLDNDLTGHGEERKRRKQDWLKRNWGYVESALCWMQSS